jgi:hypothetical protein
MTKKLTKYQPLTYELRGLEGADYRLDLGDFTRTYESKCLAAAASGRYCPDRPYFHLFLNQGDVDKGRILDQGINVLDREDYDRNEYIKHGVASYWETDDHGPWITSTTTNNSRNGGRLLKQHKTRQDALAYLDTWARRRFKRLNK